MFIFLNHKYSYLACNKTIYVSKFQRVPPYGFGKGQPFLPFLERSPTLPVPLNFSYRSLYVLDVLYMYIQFRNIFKYTCTHIHVPDLQMCAPRATNCGDD